MATNTTNISTNDTDISNLSGLVYSYWTVQGDSADTGNVDNTEVVQFTGAGNVSVTLGSPDNRTVTISGNDVSNAYTANTGLVLVGGTEFNTSGTGNFEHITFGTKESAEPILLGHSAYGHGDYVVSVGREAGSGSEGNGYSTQIGYKAAVDASGASYS